MKRRNFISFLSAVLFPKPKLEKSIQGVKVKKEKLGKNSKNGDYPMFKLEL